MKRIVILSCSCLLIAIALVAQDIPPDEIFWSSRPYTPEIANGTAIKVQSDLVEVPTVVLDSHEKPVGDLKKSDFLLFDNGKPQTISTFSVLIGAGASSTARGQHAVADSAPASSAVSAQPRYVALFFDDVNQAEARMSRAIANLTFAREGAIKFIRKGVDPDERVGIFTASGTLSLDFTNDVQRLEDTLAKLRFSQWMGNQGIAPCPPESPSQAWMIVHAGQNTAEFKAAVGAAIQCGCRGQMAAVCAQREAERGVTQAESFSLDTLDSLGHVIRYLGQMPGRRILVLTSGGFLTMSFRQQEQKVSEVALRAGVVINSLDTAGLDPYPSPFGNHFNMNLPMSGLAQDTGGKFIHNSNDLDGGLRALSAVPPVAYVLGFTPENLKSDGKEHTLRVKLVEPAHLRVNARPGYYAPSIEPSPLEKRFAQLQQNVMGADSPAEIPVGFTAVPETDASGVSSLAVTVHVDVRKLAFQDAVSSELGQRHVERLIFITALFDGKDKFLTGVEGVMDLKLKDATLKQITAQGLNAKLSIQAPAGAYRVRQVVQEAVGGRISAVSRAVEIH